MFRFDFFNEGILKNPGRKLIKIGYIKETPKLANVSNVKYFCAFWYTAQKHDK